MTSTTFTNGSTLTDDDYFNDLDRLHYDILGDPANITAIKALVGQTLSTEQASTSGTSIDFTSIPSWVQKIHVVFSGVSTSGTSNIIIQIGDSGGVETSGYLGSCISILAGAGTPSGHSPTTGFGVTANTLSTNIHHGTATLILENSSNFTWACTSIMSCSEAIYVKYGSGVKSTSAALDRIRITTVNGSDTFDAGAINIAYE